MKEYIQKNKVLFGIVILALVFHEGLENIYIKLIVPILEIPTQSPLMDGLFYFAVLFTTYLIVIRLIRGYKYSSTHTTLNFLLICGYLWYRYNYTNDFCSLHYIQSIKYLDIVAFYALTSIIIFISSYLCSTIRKVYKIILLKISKKDKGKEVYEGFYSDNPIGKDGRDLLNRGEYAKGIAHKISNTTTNGQSFAIGIVGEWGSGKTSVFDLIKNNLNQENIIKINFNPWLNHGAQSITKDFFKIMSSELRPYHSDLTSNFNRYAEILIEANNSSANNIIKPLTKVLKHENSAKEEFDIINKTIEKINKKLIIFIDDLDRLTKDEIIEVIRLIRNTANFENTFFIAAYDRNYIINALKGVNDYNTNSYLGKIFQMEITLPQFEKQKIQNKLVELITPHLRDEDIEDFNDIILNRKSYMRVDFPINHLETFRDVTRFSNSLLIAYSFLKGEIVLRDLMNLELLRSKHLGVYSLLFNKSSEFIDVIQDSYKRNIYVLKREQNEQTKAKGEFLIKKYLETHLINAGISLYQIDSCINILFSIFPNSEDAIIYNSNYNLLSIANPSSFLRYSHYGLLDNNLSEIEFSKARQGNLVDFYSKIDEWVIKELQWELKQRFETLMSYDSKSDYEKIIKSIFYLARKYVGKEHNIFGFDFHNLINRLDYDSSSILKTFYKDKNEFHAFILSIFEAATFPYIFDCEFLYNIPEINIHYQFILPIETTTELRLTYLQRYINENKILDKTTWHLFYSCDTIEYISSGENSYNKKQTKNQKAIKILKNFIEKNHLDDFLYQIIDKAPFDKKYCISQNASIIYGGFDKLKAYLETLNSENYKYTKEFLKFFNQSEKDNFKNYVDFEFKIIPIEDKH